MTDEIWKSTLDILQHQMTRATHNNCFGRTELVSDDNGIYVIKIPELVREWVENRLAGVVARALTEAIGQPVNVEQLEFVATSGSNGEADPQPAPARSEVPTRIRERRKGKRYFIDREFVFNGYAAVLGVYATAIYNALCAHVGNDSQDCHLYYSTLGLEAGMSRRQVIREIKRLEEHRMIEVERTADGRRANDISLLDVSEWRL
jgi:hypothetical protein